ncbi:hypothetical protein [Archangium sp.]|uniref:hypothetical protein n=1 Tax=Archangium sp. TaxID=1872627 RepID=UPI003899B150
MARHRSRHTPLADTRVSGLFLQLLTTEWTKESRDGQPRHATPVAMTLPDDWSEPEEGAFLLHHVYFSEQRRFAPRDWTEVRKSRGLVEVEAFRVERSEEGVRVLLDHGQLGMPGSGSARGGHHEELLRLSPGEWGRAVYNERLPYWETGHWGYCKHVLNVGLLYDVPLDVFLDTAPKLEAVREFLSRPREPVEQDTPAPRMTPGAP